MLKVAFQYTDFRTVDFNQGLILKETKSLEIFFVMTWDGAVLLAFNGERPGMPLNSLAVMHSPSQQRMI